ncbi:aldehyde dehydrogenase (NADP(+)) [Corynebacterium aquilae]|uniref:Aldehyde dehydrogenase n=1 Tax=Corynebacterium aquilae DSM 44791 TaxID=1431546 RepID=A0A1L7CI37_9CORY|nr:aldehyde dehydrogenase (NADP(+)) [Corynebacterium aquilae]APT85423.1 aldehyde dehydrogenase [Corynebacterium aquilae DSM 44791]
MVNPTTEAQLDGILTSAQKASRAFAKTTVEERARLIDAVADALDAAADQLIPIAMEETHLPEGRLTGELKRTTFQLRLFSETIREGSCFDVRVDHADPDWPMGAPRPDLRRYLVPLGPVLVFAASNFPFAFSVAGGDTASALAAGNAVVLKAHHGHLKLSEKTGEVVKNALQAAGAPEGLFDVIYGTDSGRIAVQDPRIKAAGFTGSIPGGRALFDLAVSRPDPIPFYGELGSNNPVVVTKAAADSRSQEIVDGFVGSFTLGAGQFCTKPGTLLVPAGSGMEELLEAAEYPGAQKLLNERIASGYCDTLTELRDHSDVRVLREGSMDDAPTPTLLATTAEAVLNDPETLQKECFGPTSLVVAYDSEEQLLELLETFEGQLTATLFAEEDEDVSATVEILARKAGRVIWGQWPTGVSVTYAQQHGGPYPATTNDQSTSVGTAAIARFMRPVAYQGFPQQQLPDQLKDNPSAPIPQMVNGEKS